MPDSRSQSLPKSALALVRVVGQLPLFFGEFKEKAVAPDAVGRNPLRVNSYGPTNELIKVVPVEGSAIFELP